MNTDPEQDRIKQIELLLEQEKGKNIALQRENAEIKRQAKIAEDQANALRAETDNTLSQAADDMKIALAVSQGIWAFAHMGRSYMARKVAAARIVHREKQMCLLMERMITHMGKDPAQLQTAVDQAQHVIATVNKDGEAARVAIAEAALSNGLEDFLTTVDAIVAKKNDLSKGE